MNKKNIGVAVLVAVVFAGAGFYGGMSYAKAAGPMRGNTAFAGGQFAGRMGGAGGRAGFGGAVAGQILSKDATSFTVKMQDGSTKIVLLSASTTVMKTSQGSVTDLTTGTNVVVTGSANADGSVTAQRVQLGGVFMTRPQQ